MTAKQNAVYSSHSCGRGRRRRRRLLHKSKKLSIRTDDNKHV